jgi:hypothetical protein
MLVPPYLSEQRAELLVLIGAVRRRHDRVQYLMTSSVMTLLVMTSLVTASDPRLTVRKIAPRDLSQPLAAASPSFGPSRFGLSRAFRSTK